VAAAAVEVAVVAMLDPVAAMLEPAPDGRAGIRVPEDR
jgi:hypothetical protein